MWVSRDGRVGSDVTTLDLSEFEEEREASIVENAGLLSNVSESDEQTWNASATAFTCCDLHKLSNTY